MRSNKPRGLDREKIRSMYLEGYCMAAIARKFKCQPNAISHHISDLVVPYKSQIKKGNKLTARQVRAIRRHFIKRNQPADYLAPFYGVSPTTILNVVHGIFYRWVDGEILDKDGTIKVIPKENFTKVRTNNKGRRKPGPKVGSSMSVPQGTLTPLAKEYGVSVSTVSKWVKSGRINLKMLR